MFLWIFIFSSFSCIFKSSKALASLAATHTGHHIGAGNRAHDMTASIWLTCHPPALVRVNTIIKRPAAIVLTRRGRRQYRQLLLGDSFLQVVRQDLVKQVTKFFHPKFHVFCARGQPTTRILLRTRVPFDHFLAAYSLMGSPS